MARLVAERADLLPVLGECFREHGYEGASLARIGAATGLGKGSLYHFFPGGKEEMAAAVLAEIDAWFDAEVFAPLRDWDTAAGIESMFGSCAAYFQSGRRVCLVGAFALSDTRDRFAAAVRAYFVRWIDALAAALSRNGQAEDEARRRAEAAVAGIQGAIVLARALDEPAVFDRAISGICRELLAGRP